MLVLALFLKIFALRSYVIKLIKALSFLALNFLLGLVLVSQALVPLLSLKIHDLNY